MKKKTIRVALLVDGDDEITLNEEYSYLESYLKELERYNNVECQFVRGVKPGNIDGFDMYVFDYGGADLGFAGQKGASYGMIRLVAKDIENLPNTLFIINSRMSTIDYENYIEDENPELADVYNVHIETKFADTHFLPFIEKWFGLSPEKSSKKRK